MSYRSGVIAGVIGTAVVAGAGGAAWWLFASKPPEGARPAPPGVQAAVPNPFKEDQAATVVLTADAEAKLAVRTAPAARKPMPRQRVYGGEVTVPPGKSLVVSAPLAGTLKPGAAPGAGQAVKAGTPVLHLVPLLDPVGKANLTAARVEAEGQAKSSEEQFKLTAITHERAKEVLAGGA
ncbi:MAG: hypothetical protein ACKODX_11655, partial [Gemmata sp.]